MNAIKILCQIDDIYDAVDWLLEWIQLADLTTEIRRIRDMVDVLREKVEDAFHEKNDEIDCLREEIMTLTCKEAN